MIAQKFILVSKDLLSPPLYNRGGIFTVTQVKKVKKSISDF